MEYKTLLGLIATIIGLIGYVPYFRDIFKNKTKPHLFSWLILGLLTVIAFVAQVVEGGGAGAWVTGFTAAICFIVAALALFKGEKNITKSDWFCFVGALLGTFYGLLQTTLCLL